MVIRVPHCISLSVSEKDWSTGVSNSILTQEQGMVRSYISFLNMKQKINTQPPTGSTKSFIFSLGKKKKTKPTNQPTKQNDGS